VTSTNNMIQRFIKLEEIIWEMRNPTISSITPSPQEMIEIKVAADLQWLIHGDDSKARTDFHGRSYLL
jgi:hypothetical protein